MINIRSGVAVVAVMELLTMLSLLYYSNELHQLQSKRANLIQKEEELRRSILNSEVLKDEGAAVPKAPQRNPEVRQLPPQKNPEVRQATRRRPSVASAAAAYAPVIKGESYLYEEGAFQDAKSSNSHSLSPDSSAAAEKKMMEESAIAFRQNQILSAPSINLRLVGNTTKLISQRPTQEYFHFDQELKKLNAEPLKPREKKLTVDPGKLENLLRDKVALPAAAASEDWEVWWHDGTLHVQKFVHRASAEAVFFSFNQDVARRLMYQGREVKRFVWNNDPWPNDWNPAQGIGDAADKKREATDGSTKANEHPDAQAWGLERYKGMGSSISSSGAQAVQAKQEELRKENLQNSASLPSISLAGNSVVEREFSKKIPLQSPLSPSSFSPSSLVPSSLSPSFHSLSSLPPSPLSPSSLSPSLSSSSVEVREIGKEGNIGKQTEGSASAKREVGQRPDEAAVKKMSRVPREQFIWQTEVRAGGGAMGGEDISISTHLTVDRLDRLQSYFRRWAGPMVACIYIRNSLEEKELVDRFVKALGVEGRNNYHFILANAKDAATYPANILRNLALEAVKSSHVFLLDIDLIPDPGFYKSLRTELKVLQLMSQNHVFTIPAFQGIGAAAATETQFPVDKDDLMALLRADKIKPILSGKEEFWPAFSCLNYDAWYNATQLYLADYRWPCEPYLLGSTSSIPFFDERFIHYGNDKAQHVLSLFYKQFKFAVLPFHFLVHWTHELSGWANQQKRSAHFGEVMELTEQFKFESGTQAGVNWHTGIKFSPGTYRVKDGKRIVWNGQAWIDESSGNPTDPLA